MSVWTADGVHVRSYQNYVVALHGNSDYPFRFSLHSGQLSHWKGSRSKRWGQESSWSS